MGDFVLGDFVPTPFLTGFSHVSPEDGSFVVSRRVLVRLRLSKQDNDDYVAAAKKMGEGRRRVLLPLNIFGGQHGCSKHRAL